jgi:hypothetical protein
MHSNAVLNYESLKNISQFEFHVSVEARITFWRTARFQRLIPIWIGCFQNGFHNMGFIIFQKGILHLNFIYFQNGYDYNFEFEILLRLTSMEMLYLVGLHTV